MELQQQHQQLADNYNATPQQLFFAQLIADNYTPAEAYFATIAKKKLTQQQAQQQAAELIRLNPSIPHLVEAIKKKRKEKLNEVAQMTEEELFARYNTRQGVIGELIKAATDLTGRDAAAVVQTIAKLQGFDRPEEQQEPERRRFVLRWLSHCQSCQLMRLFREVAEKKPF